MLCVWCDHQVHGRDLKEKIGVRVSRLKKCLLFIELGARDYWKPSVRCGKVYASNGFNGCIGFPQGTYYAIVKKQAHIVWIQSVQKEFQRWRSLLCPRRKWALLCGAIIAACASNKDAAFDLLKTSEDFPKARVGGVLPSIRCIPSFRLRERAIYRQSSCISFAEGGA